MKLVTMLLVVCVLALMSLGMVTLYSVSPVQDSMRYLSRQLVAGAIGVMAAVVIGRMDYRRWRGGAWWFLGLALVLLALVLVVGVKVNGARRWFRLAGFQFQPSDLAKLALLVALAHYAAAQQRLLRGFRRGILIPGLMVAPVVGLIFLEPDWGTALLLGAVAVVVLLVAGVRMTYLLPPLIVGMAAVVVLLSQNALRSDRIYSWLHLEETRKEVGYQAWQARLALGAGGVGGVGLNASTQKAFLPEHQTDFIFAIIGEEFGYVGSAAVILLFATFFGCGVVVAMRAADDFGRLVATGVTFLIGLQAFINIGVVTNALPNKGLALPFVSYGGSNLMIMLLGAGLLVSVARRAAGAEVVEETPGALAGVQVA